jgi:transposase-like protein
MAKAKASAITLSPQQEELLNQLCRRRSSAQQQVKRAKIILASANGASNSEIARRLSCDRITVRLWRERWLASSSSLTEVAQSAKDKDLLRSMEAVLSDA